jgi:RNA polymerase sigma-70 factor (ECF subfamily)
VSQLPASTLRDLLRDSRLGNEAAARVLFEHAAPTMRSYARVMLRDDDLADDAVQQAFLRVLKAPMDRLETLREPLAWLISLVRSEALTIVRTRQRSERREKTRETPMRLSTDRESIDELRSAIDAMAPAHRELLVLKHVCGLTFDQIAVAMDLSRSTAATRYSIALTALRRQMALPERQEARCV